MSDRTAAPTLRELPLRILPAPLIAARRGLGLGGSNSVHLIERHARVYRHTWMMLVSGIFEPLFYLLSIGIGIGHLVGHVHYEGQVVGYTSFVAPALLATSAMNGAIFDSTYNMFFRLKYDKLYDSALATPMGAGDIALGEIGWALLRGGLYATSFLVVMIVLGLLHSVWAIAALPMALLIGLGFSGLGMAATSYMKSWQHLEFVNLAMLPMFLFSTTFYPLSVYPRAIQVIVECTPLYQGIAVMRGLTLGIVSVSLLWHVLYLAVMGVAGLTIAGRRISRLLLR
ncbi:MAG TPA: ABC transporter permease [Streptosporangiaceae bacterium]|nr:ABC transporter permease [Streptosporangiaceae bacterium]